MIVRAVLWVLFICACLYWAILIGKEAEASEHTLTFEATEDTPNRGAFMHAVRAWNATTRGTDAPRLVRTRPGHLPDVIAEGYDGACYSQNIGRHRLRGGIHFVKVNECWMSGVSRTQRRQNWTHELGHALGLEHYRGRTVMRADASKVRGWKPREKDRRLIERTW